MTAHHVAVIQSNYLPWKGYFDMLGAVDEVLLYDEVQYTRQDWRNRNRVKTEKGLRWLSVPVVIDGLYQQRIDETRIAKPEWWRSHRDVVRQCYRGRAAEWKAVEAWMADLFEACSGLELLTEVNEVLLGRICEALSITTPMRQSSEIDVDRDGSASDRLLRLLEAVGTTTYVSGPAARAYLDEERFREHGIEVAWLDYSGYPTYSQPYGEFEHAVSIVDTIACCGFDGARDQLHHVRGGRDALYRVEVPRVTGPERTTVAVFGTSELATLAGWWFSQSDLHDLTCRVVDRQYMPDPAPPDLVAYEDAADRLRDEDARVFVAVGYQGLNRIRRDISARLLDAGHALATWIDPTAIVSAAATVGPGSCIQEGAIVQPFCTVGTGVIAWSGSVIAHHASVGDWTYIAPGAVISGNVQVGERVFLGSGCVVRDGISVGEGAVIGAGALVTRDVPPGAVVRGQFSRAELDGADRLARI